MAFHAALPFLYITLPSFTLPICRCAYASIISVISASFLFLSLSFQLMVKKSSEEGKGEEAMGTNLNQNKNTDSCLETL